MYKPFQTLKDLKSAIQLDCLIRKSEQKLLLMCLHPFLHDKTSEHCGWKNFSCRSVWVDLGGPKQSAGWPDGPGRSKEASIYQLSDVAVNSEPQLPLFIFQEAEVFFFFWKNTVAFGKDRNHSLLSPTFCATQYHVWQILWLQ